MARGYIILHKGGQIFLFEEPGVIFFIIYERSLVWLPVQAIAKAANIQ